jgi:hypothetical protein
MLLQRVNRSDPEKIFIAVKNSYSTASLTNGQAASWDYATDADGVSVTKPPARATCAGTSAAGVVAETITAGDYGLVQTYGYHSAVRARTATGGSPAIAAGRPLALSAATTFALESISTASTAVLVYPCAVSLGANATWTTAAIAAFIKSMS